MERPLCPLCNTKHFAREAHAFKDEPKTEAPLAPLVNMQERPQGDLTNGTDKPVETGVTSAVASVPFDRKAYQREYMRGWRKRKAGVS